MLASANHSGLKNRKPTVTDVIILLGFAYLLFYTKDITISRAGMNSCTSVCVCVMQGWM